MCWAMLTLSIVRRSMSATTTPCCNCSRRTRNTFSISRPPIGQAILLDNGYHKNYLEQAIEQIDHRLGERISIELSEKITPEQRAKAKREKLAKKGFVVIRKRWIVERTNAWINQCRSLWKNCEGLLETSATWIRICAIRLMLRRLA